MNHPLKIAVLMGGKSFEHDVSLNSGRGVVNALDSDRFDPIPITISREGDWQFPDADPVNVFEAVGRLGQLNPDCVFIALHGPNGEDGRLQGMLDLLGLPYTGSGCAASALAMDKVRCKAVVQAQGIRVAGHVALDRATWRADTQAVLDAVQQDLGFPCVVKPAGQGSSYGMQIPNNLDEFQVAIQAGFEADDNIMIEEFIEGTEVTCAVLDTNADGFIRPLPLTEIRPQTATWFDYEAKYTPGATLEVTPAEIDAALTDQVQEMAVHVHEIVGCKGWSRSDFIIDKHGPVWFEVNTVPGLTETSLYPQACNAAGITYAQMVEHFIEDALRRSGRTAPAGG